MIVAREDRHQSFGGCDSLHEWNVLPTVVTATSVVSNYPL